MNLIIDYPWWFFLICLACGFFISALLYFRHSTGDLNPNQKNILATLRFVAASLIAFLLLSPILQRSITRQQEPIILFMQDNSLSVITGLDSLYMQSTYKEGLSSFSEEISAHYQLRKYAFGEFIEETDRFDFSHRLTHISEIFQTIDVLYSNRNLGALIIASDGIYNRGQNPLILAERYNFPIYTMALGDTIPQKDLIINRLHHNRITYLNNFFPVQVMVQAIESQGETTYLRVWHEGEQIHEQQVSINSDNYFEEVNIELEAYETGIKRYRVELDPLENEMSLANNTQDFFIEVIDSRQKVLILAQSPHPDIAAISFALQDNENYEVESALISGFEGSLQAYDLVIWHQLPSVSHPSHPLFQEAASQNKPQLFILGAQSNLNAFNRLQTGLRINRRSEGFNDARAIFNTDHTFFTLSEEAMELVELFPPLNVPFAHINLSPAAQIFLSQMIGSVPTQQALVAFSDVNNQKTGLISGEGIWRWRLNNFARRQNHNAFNEIISKTIQYLSVVEDRSFFRMNANQFLYENQELIIEAELYNQSYELVNTPEVELSIINEEGIEFPYLFSRTTNAYRLNAGTFPVGEYSYIAQTTLGEERYTLEGFFSVSPLNIETVNTLANHNLLNQMAENTQGKMFFPDEWEQLLEHIMQREDIRPVLYTERSYEDIINLKWIFFIILILLSAEWFIRKFRGGY